MKRRNLGLRWKLLRGWLALSGCIAAQTTRLPLTNAMVADALRVRGVEINAANVHLPMSLYVAGPLAALTVVGLEIENGNRLRVLMRCIRITDCVRFTATVDVDGTSAEKIISIAMTGVAASPGGKAVMPMAMLHAGDHLALSMQQEHLVLRMPCLAVDTGAVGETIRVSSLDRRKIFRAIVTGPGTATGVAE